MPDIQSEHSLGLKRRWVDNGDGTYSELVAAAVAAPVGGATSALQSAASPKDSAGTVFDLESCSRVLTYSAGNLISDAATYGGVTRVRTYTYVAGLLTGISLWVVQ